MRDSLRHFIAEFVGTFALVFVGGGAIAAAQSTQMEAGLIGVALAHGIILAVMVSATMRISGHLNPAVTIGFLAARRIEPMMAGLYIVAQLLGAMAAPYALKALLPSAIASAINLGVQRSSLGITLSLAVVLEGIATFVRALCMFETAVDPQAPRIGGLAIGFAI